MRRFPAAVLGLAALALPLPAAAQAWNSDAALALARRAIARRSGAARDTALHDYKAQAHGFLFFLGAFGRSEERRVGKECRFRRWRDDGIRESQKQASTA